MLTYAEDFKDPEYLGRFFITAIYCGFRYFNPVNTCEHTSSAETNRDSSAIFSVNKKKKLPAMQNCVGLVLPKIKPLQVLDIVFVWCHF